MEMGLKVNYPFKDTAFLRITQESCIKAICDIELKISHCVKQ